ncbi:MAG TPA: sigma-70 family RNA polymerase sigma factor [Longimicrobium sp.]|nr:sigma-70 family RNA polymerase sigma factor [Longimicrobium sp.]
MTTISAPEAGTASLDVYFRDLHRYPLLTVEEERELGRAAQAGDAAARERLVTSNLRFAVTIAKKYQGFGLPLEDLISEANQGLMRAAEKFDPERGFRFLSYAVNWITAKIDRALEHAPIVRRKGSAPQQARVVRRAAAKLSQRLGATPTTAEIAHAIGMEEADVAAALNVHHALSLDQTFEDSTATLLDQLESTDEELPDDRAYDAERREVIGAVLDTLPEREARTLRLRFGLDESPLTQEQISERFGLTRQRIQQLESQALKRLREHSRAVHLLPFHDSADEAAEAGHADGTGQRAIPLPRRSTTGHAPTPPPPAREPVRTRSPAPAATRRPWDTSVALAARREPGSPWTVRGYVAERIRGSSLDAVAQSSGVPPEELRDYLFGIRPPSASLQRLRRWYEQAVPRAERAVEAEPMVGRAPSDEDRPPRATASPAPRRASTAGWGFVRGGGRDPFGVAQPHRRMAGVSGAGGRNAPVGERPGLRRPALDPEEEADRFSEIREFARTRGEHQGGRRVAAEIGIPGNTFWNFLQGARPREPHAPKILRWYETAPRDEMEAAPGEYRSVPVETLRQFLQAEAGRTSIGRAARAAGVGKSGLALFLSNHTRTPHPRTRRLLAMHYLRRQEEIAGRTGTPEAAPAPPCRRSAGEAPGGATPGAPHAVAPSTAPPDPSPGDQEASTPETAERPGPGSPACVREGSNAEAATKRNDSAAEAPRAGESERVPPHAAETELRRFYLGVALRTSVAAVAGSVRVPVPDLMAFLQGGEAAGALCLALQTDYGHRALLKARALDALVEDIEPAALANTRRRIVLALARGFRQGGHHCPGWLRDVLRPTGAQHPAA